MEFVNVADNAKDVVSALQHMHRNLSHTEDFEFISKDGQHFSSHQLILAIHSSVLADMIYGPNSCRSITIEDVDNCAIQNLISYCYAEDLAFATDSVSDVTETKIIADKFQIFELSKICIERFSNIDVNLSNVISVLKTSIEFNNAEKESECLLLIKEHKEEVFASELFKAIKFENVLEIFEKLRDRNFLSEFEFLNSSIQWLETNERRNEGKKELMNKINISRIPLNQYLDIIVSFPEFFSNTEISGAVNVIRSSEHNGDNEELNQQEMAQNQAIELDEVKFYQDAETNTEETNKTSSLDSQKLKQLTIQIIKETDDVDAFLWPEKVKVIVKDDMSTRSLQFPICDQLKIGLIGSMIEDVYYAEDVDISYDGIFYMTGLLHDLNLKINPLQYIESLKAAFYFKLKELSDKIILDIKDIIDYDPLFLEGLNSVTCLQNRCLYLLTSNPMEVILHPNYVNCSAELILLLLEQDELKIGNESQALDTCIVWLEARNRQRWNFRFVLLNKIAFRSMSTAEFQYAIKTYPDFFTNSEKESILAYKMAEADENKAISQENLPEWYNYSKSRRILLPD